MTSLDRPDARERSPPVPPSMGRRSRPRAPALDDGAAPPRSFWTRHEHALLGTISMVVFLSFWETSVDFGWVNPLFTSSPSRIVRTAIEMFADGSIWSTCRSSGIEFVVGYGARHRHRRAARHPDGLVQPGRRGARSVRLRALRHAAHRASAAGHDLVRHRHASKIAIVFLGAIFPILVNTITGVRTVNADFVKVARSFGSNDRQMFLTVVLPSSVPLLLTGLAAGPRTRAGRHRGRRDVRRHPRARLPDRDGGRALPDRQGDGRHHHHRRRRHCADRIAAPDRAALRTLAAKCRGMRPTATC